MLPDLSPVLPGAPRLVVGAPSHSEGRQECPPRVWYSPDIDPSKFTLHILSDTPGGLQWLKYILLMSQMCWCTGSKSWCGRDWRNDWVWVKQRLGRCHGALNGCLLWRLQRLFTIKLLNKDVAFVEYWLALALTTIPEYSSYLDPIFKFVEVRKAQPAFAFSMGNIVSCAHVIPEIATSS